jgi:hypothetical protein
MPGKILKRGRKLAQSEPPILKRLEMAANRNQDIKNHKKRCSTQSDNPIKKKQKNPFIKL